MVRYAIQVWSSDMQAWINAPAPLADFMAEQIIHAELWFPTERVRVVPVRIH